MHKMTSNPSQHFLMPVMALALMAVVDVLTGGFLRESFSNVRIEYVAASFMAIVLFGVTHKESSRRPMLLRTFSRQKL